MLHCISGAYAIFQIFFKNMSNTNELFKKSELFKKNSSRKVSCFLQEMKILNAHEEVELANPHEEVASQQIFFF